MVSARKCESLSKRISVLLLNFIVTFSSVFLTLACTFRILRVILRIDSKLNFESENNRQNAPS
jgi:hypothetical protein